MKESGITQVLEVACGFTSRGLNFCKQNDNMVYVELNLSKVIKEKKTIFNKVASPLPKSLHFIEGNALNNYDINGCLKYFDLSKPIAVIKV